MRHTSLLAIAAVSATAGTAFFYVTAAKNDPTSYTATGLPADLSIDSPTGIISGTPTLAGTYSVTLGALRRARRRWHLIVAKNDGTRLDVADLEAQLLADDDETTLVIGSWAFAGTGWASDGDAVLANAAAARAREYAQHRAQTKHANN